MTETRTMTTDRHANHCHHHHCFSWSAVFVGAVIIVGLSFLLNLLSLAVGFSAFNVSEGNKLEFVSGGFIALTAITVIIMYIGGYVAGAMGKANCGKRRLGEVYGFTAWCLALIIGILIASGLSKFIANYDYTIGRNMPSIEIAAKEMTGQDAAAPSTKEAATALSTATFVTFFLFGIGALSASFGGYIGMKKRRSDEVVVETH